LHQYNARFVFPKAPPDKATLAPPASEWPLKHSQAIRDFAASRGKDLDKIDSVIESQPDLFETYQAYGALHDIYYHAKERDTAEFISKKMVDFLNGFIAKNSDNTQVALKAKGLLLDVLLRQDLGGEYLARHKEWGLDEFETYRKYYPDRQIDDIYVGYVNRLQQLASRNLYSWNPDLKFDRESLERVLRETETWENKYDWAKKLTDLQKEKLRRNTKCAVFFAETAMIEVEKRDKNYAIALQYVEKARATLSEIPRDSPTLLPELRERLTKVIELQVGAIRQLQGAFDDPPSSMTAPASLFPPAANLTRQNSQMATGTCSTSSCACGCSATTATATVPCCK